MSDMAKRKPAMPARKRSYQVMAGIATDPSFNKLQQPLKRPKLNTAELDKRFKDMNLGAKQELSSQRADAEMAIDTGNVIGNEASQQSEAPEEEENF